MLSCTCMFMWTYNDDQGVYIEADIDDQDNLNKRFL